MVNLQAQNNIFQKNLKLFDEFCYIILVMKSYIITGMIAM